jgi:hypothetical protein
MEFNQIRFFLNLAELLRAGLEFLPNDLREAWLYWHTELDR